MSNNVLCNSGFVKQRQNKILLCTKISKWIENFNVYPETLKLRGKSIDITLEDTCRAGYFLNKTSFTQELRLSIDKWNIIKLKSSVQQRKKEDGAVVGKRVFAKWTSHKRLVS